MIETHSKHYEGLTIQPLELMQMLLTEEELRGFFKGNIIKYVLRAGHKEGEPFEKDLDKAKVYAKWLKDLNKKTQQE